MMRIVIDTNVIIDYLADRAPFADDAGNILSLCESEKMIGMVTANAITDIYVKKSAKKERLMLYRRSARFLASSM